MPTLNLSHGGRLYYEVKGAPPPAPAVVFLNGTAQTTVAWTHQARSLAARYQTVCYDARTQGRRSALGTAAPDLDQHIRDLRRLLDHLDLARVHLVGLSHGALLALAAAVRWPQTVAALVLINPGDPASGRIRTVLTAWRQILAAADQRTLAWSMLPLVLGADFLKDRQGVLAQMTAAIAQRNQQAALKAHLTAMTAYPPLAVYAGADLPPALFMIGGDDPLTDPAAVQALAAAGKGKVEILPRIGHSLPVEAPRRCTRIIAQWLAQHSAGAVDDPPAKGVNR